VSDLSEVVVHRVIWKHLTNKEIRQASTEKNNFRIQTASDDLIFGETKAGQGDFHPWLLVEFSHQRQTQLLAFSRNSADSCQGDREDLEYLGPSLVWLNHTHDWHPCDVITLCGKVNFNLGRKGDWSTVWKVKSVQAFKSANRKPLCCEDDPDLIAKLLSSSGLIRRLGGPLNSPSKSFLETLK
jgi:hypothetical protein